MTEMKLYMRFMRYKHAASAQWTSNIELFLFIQMNNKLLSIGLWILTAVFCVIAIIVIVFPGLNIRTIYHWTTLGDSPRNSWFFCTHTHGQPRLKLFNFLDKQSKPVAMRFVMCDDFEMKWKKSWKWPIAKIHTNLSWFGIWIALI